MLLSKTQLHFLKCILWLFVPLHTRTQVCDEVCLTVMISDLFFPPFFSSFSFFFLFFPAVPKRLRESRLGRPEPTRLTLSRVRPEADAARPRSPPPEGERHVSFRALNEPPSHTGMTLKKRKAVLKAESSLNSELSFSGSGLRL